MISASALTRLIRCPGSAAIPQSRTASVWSDQGTANHERREEQILAGDFSEFPEEIRDALADHDDTQSEVAVAYDVATGHGRILGTGLRRQYHLVVPPLAPYEVPGTIDMIAMDAARTRALVIDFKLWQEVDWIQLTFYALAVARAWNLNEVTIALLYEGTGRVRWKRLDAIDLDAFAAEHLAELHQRVAAEQAKVARNVLPDTNEGPWCKHCPAQHACPGKVALARRVILGDEANTLALLKPLDAANAAMLYDRIKAARAALATLEKAVYARAAEDPIPLANGKVLGLHTKQGNEQLDGDVVWSVVSELHGREVADQVVTREATKKRLTEVLKAKGAKEVIAAVKERGGVIRKESTEVREYDPAKLIGDGEAA